MVGLSTSCDPEKLKKILLVSKLTMKAYYGLSREDREEILVDVMYRFEVDKGKFPLSVYIRHCHNKIIGFLGKKTAQKRMARRVIDGKVSFIDDVSLSMEIGSEGGKTLEDIIPSRSDELLEVELLAAVEQSTPDLVPIVKKVLDGYRLTISEKRKLKNKITTGIVGEKKGMF